MFCRFIHSEGSCAKTCLGRNPSLFIDVPWASRHPSCKFANESEFTKLLKHLGQLLKCSDPQLLEMLLVTRSNMSADLKAIVLT